MDIYVIKEHHEAFPIIRKKYRDIKKVYKLINIDEHHDLGRAILSLNEFRENNLKNDIFITYNNLRVSDFIMPLVYEGIIDELIWINNYSYMEEKFLDYTYKKNGVYKIIYPNINESKGIKYISSNILDNNININEGTILSIDFDFFSSDNISGERVKIEITKSEYENIMVNKYHKIRLNYGSQVTVQNVDGKYYMYLDMLDGDDKIRFRDTHIIDLMIEYLDKFIDKKIGNPEFIILCKSSISNYTHIDSQKYIEIKLKDLFNKKYKNINWYGELND